MLSSRTISPFLLILALASLPLSMVVCQVFLVLLCILSMLESPVKEKWQMSIREPLLWGYAALIAAHFVGIVYSDDLSNAFFNIEKKVALFILPFIFAMSRPIDPIRVRQGLLAYVAGCLVATLWSMISSALRYSEGNMAHNFDPASQALYLDLHQTHSSVWDMFSYIELASGIRSHPTFLALYLVFAIIIVFHFAFRSFRLISKGQQILIIALIVWFEVFIALLSSRVMVVGLTMVLLITLIRPAINSSEPATMPKSLIVLFLFPSAMLWINPVTAYRVWQEPLTADTYQPNSDGVYVYSTGIRKSLWQVSLHTVRNTNALVGAGTGDVKTSMKLVGDELSQSNIMNSYDPHNQYLYTQVGLGIMGLSALLFCLAYPAWRAWIDNDTLYLSFTWLFAILCLTESALETQQGITFFALFSSLFSFQNRQYRLDPILPSV